MSLPCFSISAIDGSLPVERLHDLYFFGASLTFCAIYLLWEALSRICVCFC